MADKPTVPSFTSNATFQASKANELADDLATAIEGCLGRGGTGESPNSMTGNLDMDLNKIQNLGTPAAPNDAARLFDISDSDATGAASAQLRLDLASEVDYYGVDLVGNATRRVDTYTELLAITSQSNKDQVILGGRVSVGDDGGGIFYWASSDLSTEVTADTQSGIYVAPTSDATGASGAWVRQYSGAVNVKWFGTTAPAFKGVESILDDNMTVYIGGTYSIDIVDSDLTDPDGKDREYAYILVEGKTNVHFVGNGVVNFDVSSATERAWFIIFKDCVNCSFNGPSISGDFLPEDDVPNSETGVGYGIMLYNSQGCKLSNSTLSDLLVPWSVTGQPTSPATVADVSKDNLITNNTFSNFEQCSTFGAGAANLLCMGNVFINPNTGVKISRNPFVDASSVGVSKNISIHDNIFTWTSDREFSEVWFDPGKAQPIIGVQYQASTDSVSIKGNTIDQSDVTVPTLPFITDSAPIVQYYEQSGGSGEYDPSSIDISNNILIANESIDNYAVLGMSNTHRLSIDNNKCVGGIRVSTATVTGFTYDRLSISGNELKHLVSNPPIISVSAGNFGEVDISLNKFIGDPTITSLSDECLLVLSNFIVSHLYVKGNILPEGKISDYSSGALNADRITVAGNSAKGIDILNEGATRISVIGNDIITDTVAILFELDASTKADCMVNVSGNSASGKSNDGAATALSLNGGKLSLKGNAWITSGTSPFIFDASVNLFTGEYYGVGAPSVIALTGCLYNDFGVGSDGSYIKTTATGSTGWAKIAFV